MLCSLLWSPTKGIYLRQACQTRYPPHQFTPPHPNLLCNPPLVVTDPRNANRHYVVSPSSVWLIISPRVSPLGVTDLMSCDIVKVLSQASSPVSLGPKASINQTLTHRTPGNSMVTGSIIFGLLSNQMAIFNQKLHCLPPSAHLFFRLCQF